MYNYIRQIEVNMADEPLKIEQPLLESSSEIDKLVYDQYQAPRKNFPKNLYRKSLNILKDPCRSAVVLT